LRRVAPVGGNVVGKLAGASEEDDPVLVTAHYDGVGDEPGMRLPGAADNASGVAAMLAAAGALVGAGQPQRPIWFAALDGEEVNALGSAAHARALAERGIRPVVLNIDMAAGSAASASVEL